MYTPLNTFKHPIYTLYTPPKVVVLGSALGSACVWPTLAFGFKSVGFEMLPSCVEASRTLYEEELSVTQHHITRGIHPLYTLYIPCIHPVYTLYAPFIHPHCRICTYMHIRRSEVLVLLS